MQNTPNGDKRYKRDEFDQTLPKPVHDDHDHDVQRPDDDTAGMAPVRQTERREDRANDDGMRPAERPEESGL